MRKSLFLVCLLVALPAIGQTIDGSILTELEAILTELETGYQELQMAQDSLTQGLTISQTALTDLEASFKNYEKTVKTQIKVLERTNLFLKIGLISSGVILGGYIIFDILRD